MESRIRIGKWNKDWEMKECIISGVSRVLYVAETIGVDQYFTPCLISTEQMMRVLQNRILFVILVMRCDEEIKHNQLQYA